MNLVRTKAFSDEVYATSVKPSLFALNKSVALHFRLPSHRVLANQSQIRRGRSLVETKSERVCKKSREKKSETNRFGAVCESKTVLDYKDAILAVGQGRRGD
jgi:hypothetical protein